jgi:hypothetical protein
MNGFPQYHRPKRSSKALSRKSGKGFITESIKKSGRASFFILFVEGVFLPFHIQKHTKCTTSVPLLFHNVST